MTSLIFAMQLIWDELGEIDADRDKQLLAIEEECLQVSLVTHAFLRSHGQYIHSVCGSQLCNGVTAALSEKLCTILFLRP